MLLSTQSRVLLFSGFLMLGLFVSRSRAQDIQVADISFVDDLHGWVSVAEPIPGIFRTSDGGKTWTRFNLPSQHGFYRLHFFDRNTGIGIEFESEKTTAIYRTVDAGQTWTKVNNIEAQHGEHVVDLNLTSRNDGFFVGEGEMGRGYVTQMLNGGHTLRVRKDLPADFTQQSNTLGVFGDGTGHVWIVGKELILYSGDDGKTWENQYLNTTPKIDMGVSGTALPGGHAWIAVANFEIYRTEDYGKHWVKALTTVDEGGINFQSVSFENLREGCAVGNSSFIYCTNDGGITWSRSRVFKTFPNGSPFFSKLQLFSASPGWASMNGALYKTENGGRSFTEVLTASEPTESEGPGEFQALKTSVNGPTELAYDKDGFLFIVESMQERLLRLNTKHDSIKVMLPEPECGLDQEFDNPNAIAADQKGNLFIADFNGRLRQLDTRSGDVTVLLPAPPDHSGGPLEVPAAMTVDGQGNVLVVDRHHHKLFRWRPGEGKLETVAGTGVGGFGGDGALAADAELAFPEGVAVNKGGDIFIADYQNCRIRKIDAKTQIITTLAGTGECASRGDDGLAIKAALNYPSSIVLDGAGNLFFVEGATDRVRRIDGQGVIKTYAGTGQKGYSGDGGPADKATLNNPSGLAMDSNGTLYISEYVNNRIRRVDAVTHVITTVAGDGKPKRIDVVM
jgi:photosystem II stability/assembly factor-like uncharacterized protein/sugar lactone lactonase YvrE